MTTTTNSGGVDSGRVGAIDTVNLPGVGTVSRQQVLDTTGTLIGYNYFVKDSTGITQYGSDEITAGTSTVTQSTRYNPGFRIPFNLTPGQTFSQSNIVATTTDFTTSPSTVSTFTFSYSVTFIGFQSVTVPAGTFPNSADFKYTLSADLPGSGSFTITSESWAAPNIGTVKSHNTTVLNSTTFSSNIVSDDVFLSGTVGGVTYP